MTVCMTPLFTISWRYLYYLTTIFLPRLMSMPFFADVSFHRPPVYGAGLLGEVDTY